ncbi:DUF6252 family protein [Mucilaginibacter sp. PPCGB 2223]|uniref:DUF6252 family protein n=1 Tax=Mucilaginibacter sp. PPCGB 2223 TaxID=1886027 RepID=UPI0011127DDF|nr:DUF6252 family protein [Mucilaginibacter sp. PPCGB 2223]
MKKFTLAVVLVLSALLLQYCKKDSESATTTNTALYTFSSYVNDTLWVPTAYNAQVAYTAAAKNRVFTVTGTLGTQQVNFAVTQPNASSVGNGFPTGTFNIDATGKVVASYARAASSTSTTFVPQGTVKSGYVSISAVDSVKMTMTGTFTFNTVSYTYDTGGNITSLTVNSVTGGAFNNLPYTFKKQ